MSAHNFTDAIDGASCVLIIDTECGWWEGGVGITHPGCDRPADVMPDLDAFYCPACRRNGRVSGAWVMDCWDADDAAVTS